MSVELILTARNTPPLTVTGFGDSSKAVEAAEQVGRALVAGLGQVGIQAETKVVERRPPIVTRYGWWLLGYPVGRSTWVVEP